MIRDDTNDIIKVMIKRFITGLYVWLEIILMILYTWWLKIYYWIIWMIRDYTNDIIQVMIKDFLLDYMND